MEDNAETRSAVRVTEELLCHNLSKATDFTQPELCIAPIVAFCGTGCELKHAVQSPSV